MDTSATSGVDPTGWTALIEQAFFARLREVLAPHDVEQQVRSRLAELDEQLQHLVHNPMDAANVRFTSLAVAAYDVLEPAHGPAGATAVVEDCLNSPFRDVILVATASLLDDADDPFAALVAAGKERESTYFGPSFTFERPVDDQHSYVLDVIRCLFHEALVAAGHTHLQAVMCRFDLNWVDAIDPDRHHVRFVRPVTFATGDTCRMCFLRQESSG